MKVVSTFHPSSSVVSSAKCHLSSRDLEHLAVAKLNRLDVYSLRPSGLQHECGLDVWGKICSVRAIPISLVGDRSTLVVLLTHPEPELLFLSLSESINGGAALIVTKQLNLFERSPRVAEFYTDVLVHPSGRIALISCYAGKLKVIALEAGKFKEEFDISIPEANLLSLAFLPGDDYTIAMLFLDPQDRLQLCSREIDVETFDLAPSNTIHSTIVPNKCIPSPAEVLPRLIPVQPQEGLDTDESEDDQFHGGVLVVGGRQILLYPILSRDGQEKQKGKQRRLETKKKSTDAAEAIQARAKEKERESRVRKPKATVEWPWSEVSAWCAIDGVPARFFIGDVFGRLSLLSLEKVDEFGMILIPLGETSRPETLTYLTNQTLYLGSHLGDSQLLRVSATPVSSQQLPSLSIPYEIKPVTSGSLAVTPSRKGKEKASDKMDVDYDQIDLLKGRVLEPMGSFITVLEAYKNIAPIMDALLLDIDGSGEKEIVTCSGEANTGSVNIIRNGANFQELAFVAGVVDIVDMWPVKRMFKDSDDTYLLVSTITSTLFFQINDRGRSTTLSRFITGQVGDLETKHPTLAFSNIYDRVNNVYKDSAFAIQVTLKGPTLLEWNTALGAYEAKATWDIPKSPHDVRQVEVVAASVNSTQVVMALTGGKVVVLCIEDNNASLRQVASYDPPSGREISAISCIPLKSQAHASTVIAVAYWKTLEVEILKLSSAGLLPLDTRSGPLPAVTRSLLLYNFGPEEKGPDSHPYLLAGLGNGSVAIMQWKESRITDLKIISLGRAPVTLVPYEVDERKAVFAAGNRSILLYLDKNRLASSPTMLKEVSAAARLNTQSFPSTLVLAAPTGLSIGRIDELNRLHIRTASLKLDNPRRIAHSVPLRVFGVVCTRSDPVRVGSFEPLQSSFQILDDNSLERVCQYNSPLDEVVASVVTSTISSSGQEKPYFCVGTFLYKQEEVEPSAGRLLVFTATVPEARSRKAGLELFMATSCSVKGCVYALKVVQGNIIAAVNSSIIMFRLEVETKNAATPEFALKQLAEWNHSYMVTSLGAIGDVIVAGDQVSSVSLLKATETTLVAEARDYGPLYPIAVEALGSKALICANDSANIFSMRLGQILGRTALERDGGYYLADIVSVFLRGSLTASHDDDQTKLKPELLFFTSTGRIGIIVDVPDKDLSLHLTELQRNLSAVIPGIGGSGHAKHRAPKENQGRSDADRAAYGFVDGDFIEQFLTIAGDPDLMAKVMAGGSAPEALSMSQEQILQVIEQLQGLH